MWKQKILSLGTFLPLNLIGRSGATANSESFIGDPAMQSAAPPPAGAPPRQQEPAPPTPAQSAAPQGVTRQTGPMAVLGQY